MRSAITLLTSVIALSCSPSTTPAAAAPVRLAFDASVLAPLHAPTSDAPLVVYQGELGLVSAPSRVFSLDDLEEHTLGGPPTLDAPPPARAEPLSPEASAQRLMAQESPRSPQEVVRALVVGRQLSARGQPALADAVLRTIATDSTTLQARAREAVSGAVLERALRAYARGGSPEALVLELSASASFRETRAARSASDALTAARSVDAPPKPDGTPLDALVRKRIEELHQATCEAEDEQWPGADPIGRVRALGYTAVPALFDAQADAHLTRCFVDAEPPRLEPVGAIARDVVQRITRGAETFDPTDVECGHEGADKEATDLVEAALARRDVAGAIAVTRSALGGLRVKMVEKLANVGGTDVVAFLAQEAAGGPVLLARVEAARMLSATSGDWVAPLTAAVIDALSRSDASPERCDGARVVSDGLRALLRAAPRETLTSLEARQASRGPLGPRAQLRLAPTLTTLTPPSAGAARSRDALLGSMLDDVRPQAGLSMTFQGSTCADPSPSDAAALALGKRLGVAYTCAMSAEQKRAAVRQLQAKLGTP